MENQSSKQAEFKIRLLYPIWMVIAIFSVAFVPAVILVEGDMIMTFENIQSSEQLFRLSILGSIFTQVLHLFIPIYLYRIFEDANKKQAKLMLILALISIPLTLGFDVFKIALLNLKDPSLVYHYLNLSQSGLTISSIFWGLWLYPLGRLVINSNLLPKVLGYILILSCMGYIISSIIKIGFPELSPMIIFAEALTFGEVLFALWFVVKGLNIEK